MRGIVVDNKNKIEYSSAYPYLSSGCFMFKVRQQFYRYEISNWEWKVQNYTHLFMNINNNNAPFVSLTWLQKKRLGCVVYSHCPTNDSCSKCIHSCCCCLPCNCVTKPFGILKRVIKSQKVCISFGHSKSRKTFSLRKACG